MCMWRTCERVLRVLCSVQVCVVIVTRFTLLDISYGWPELIGCFVNIHTAHNRELAHTPLELLDKTRKHITCDYINIHTLKLALLVLGITVYRTHTRSENSQTLRRPQHWLITHTQRAHNRIIWRTDTKTQNKHRFVNLRNIQHNRS